MVVAPSRARPVWLVISPTRLPRRAANPSARSTSMPLSTGAAVTGWIVPEGARSRALQAALRSTAGGSSVSADAAIVATRARSGVTSPLPSGWTRFDMNTTNILVAGSIHSEVPVKPVWPKDPSGRSSPRLAAKDESMSQPRPRTLRSPGGIEGLIIRATVSGARMRTPSCDPLFNSIRAKMETSAAVLNSPACPATPAMRRAVGSCTTPRSIFRSGPSHGHPYGVQFSVGAMRGCSAAGGLNPVSFIPSGLKIRSRANSSSGLPLTRRTMSPRRKKLMSL